MTTLRTARGGGHSFETLRHYIYALLIGHSIMLTMHAMGNLQVKVLYDIPLRDKLLIKPLDWPLICGKWFVACIAITFVVCQPLIRRLFLMYNDDRLEHRTVQKASPETMVITTRFPTARSYTPKWLETYWRWIHRRVTD